MTYIDGLRCLNCGETFPDQPTFDGCPACRTEDFTSNLAPVYDYEALRADLSREAFGDRDGGVWAYPELLPVDEAAAVSIGEGATPLVETPGVADACGVSNLYLKDESQNPTWSYKDRLSAVALSHAKATDAEVVTIASTGNHGASIAAYAARSGIECVIFTIPDVPETMKTLMQVYGASVIATPTHDDRWTIMRKCIDAFDWYPTGNYVFPPVGSNFYGIEGYKSIAYELCADLDWSVPDWIVQPTAYADGLSGIWRGFVDLHELGFIDRLPKLAAVEPYGPLKNALDRGLDRVEPVDTDETIAFSIGAGVSTYQGLTALRESGGTAVVTDDEQLRDAQRLLGSSTGMYAEASSVAAVAGLKALVEDGTIDEDETVVAMSTSTGLKDTEMTAERLPSVPTIDPEVDQLRSALAEHYEIELE
ncbi:threonine synthase [Halovivax cerinus]|uniref:Pyridoxal-phosphate dependent enzyme n=1 Tax=Halovivax cerinus TaxID=1487865 RepID=A0ABD5NQF4_9EURY|nr:threonine synthase [Halovivax cerinus]